MKLKPRRPPPRNIWYEFDWYGGVALTLPEGFSLTAAHVEFISPADIFATTRNLEFKLAWDDSTLWDGKFALYPRFKVFIELDGKAGNGPEEGVYCELGVAPAFELIAIGESPVTFTLPIALGLGAANFYANDETFGFVSVGGVLSAPLIFIPKQYGQWMFSVGVTGYFLGDALDDPNSIQASDDTVVVSSLTLSVTW